MRKGVDNEHQSCPACPTGRSAAAPRPPSACPAWESHCRRRWCMNTIWAASPPQLRVLFDTDGDRHAEAGHLVEGVAGDFGFGLLIGQTPGMKTPADDGLVWIHRRF